MLSRESISLPLWRQIAAETALQSQNTQTHTGISLAEDCLYCRRSNTQSIQLLALDFTFFMILSDRSIEWKRLKLNLRLCIEHLSICLSFAIKTSQTNMCNVTHLIETRELDSPSKRGASESILSLYPAGDPALVFLWKKKVRVIRRSSYVCHEELKGPRLNSKLISPLWVSPSHAKYPLSFSVLRSSSLNHPVPLSLPRFLPLSPITGCLSHDCWPSRQRAGQL